jgi:hypothetical protein
MRPTTAAVDERAAFEARKATCTICGGKAEGWENMCRLRLCFDCAASMRMGNGDPIDFSPDDHGREAEYEAKLQASLGREKGA